jgi:hypothetical protein
MRSAKSVVLLMALLVVGLLVVGCATTAPTGRTPTTTAPTEQASATQKAAIAKYIAANNISIPEMNVAGTDGYGDKPTVSKEDPNWEIDYAFPAAEEGAGTFFLLRKAGGGWTVVAHTAKGKVGWTADELKALGAPTDIRDDLDPSQQPSTSPAP